MKRNIQNVCQWCLTGFFISLFLIWETKLTFAQSKISENQLRAAYIASFGGYVEWPETSFSNASAPFVIGVIHDDSLRELLELTFKQRRILGRSVQIQVIENYKQATKVHILYDGDESSNSFIELSNLPILTIGARTNFIDQGGMVRLFTQENRLRFELNPKVAERAGLKLSAKLQQLALRTYEEKR